MSKKGKTKAKGKPKKKCCASKPKCRRCPLRMLADGTLPDGYGVKHRKLVRLEAKKGKKRQGGKQGKKGKKLAQAA